MGEVVKFPSTALENIFREGENAFLNGTLGYFQCPYVNSQATKTWREGWLKAARFVLRNQIKKRNEMGCPWQ